MLNMLPDLTMLPFDALIRDGRIDLNMRYV